MSKLGPKTIELISILNELTALLEQQGIEHWRRWIAEARDCLQNSDFRGIKVLLSAYGGMGSFNDLILPSEDANERLNKLSSHAYDLADAIRREVERPVP